MEQNPSLEAITSSACQENPHILLNLKFHDRVDKSSPLFPILSYSNPVHSHPICFLNIHFSTIFRHRLGVPSGLFTPVVPTKTLYIPLFSPIRATCPVHPILYMIIRIIFGEERKYRSSSQCSLLQSSVISPLLGPNTVLSTLISNILRLGTRRKKKNP